MKNLLLVLLFIGAQANAGQQITIRRDHAVSGFNTCIDVADIIQKAFGFARMEHCRYNYYHEVTMTFFQPDDNPVVTKSRFSSIPFNDCYQLERVIHMAANSENIAVKTECRIPQNIYEVTTTWRIFKK